MTGCDTTSYIFRKGKANGMAVLKKQPSLRKKLAIFNQPNANNEELLEAGRYFCHCLYGLKMGTQINYQRYLLYNKAVAKQTLERDFNLASLPPTEDALNQHILR